MINKKEKLKSSPDLDFVKIVEDQKPDESESVEDLDFVFFCKDCKEIIKTDFKIFGGRKIYKCLNCGGEKVVSGSEKSIKKYYRI
ncbi:hypothetical protein LR002_03265 [Candidatus Gracilibacteria bacterium]|nr:hypothetical protein [Candidatus Gracilibacteria bacterium]